MRHRYTNRVVVLITLLLVAAAASIAWRQSRPSAPPPETSSVPGARAPLDQGLVDLGKDVYARACMGCHASNEPGREVPRRLSGQTAELLALEGGPDYLVNLMLYGASGPAAPGQRPLRHPPFGNLSDRELTGVLNFLCSEDDTESALFTPETIARFRSTPRTREEVAASRPTPGG